MQHVDEDTVLQLSHLAYKTTQPSSRPNDPGPSRAAPSPVRKDPPDYLPDSQLARLSTCIGCGLEWTSRKTATQKRTHIKQCAKKHALDKDTIKILVEKEFSISSPALLGTDLNEITLMDSVLSTGPRKSKRRPQVLPTVKSLPETRDSISSRARDILGPTSGNADPQPTQQFGQSALARRNLEHPKRPASLDANRSVEELPSTQPFGASSLRAEIVNAKRAVDGSEESPFLRFDASKSLFAQDSVLSSTCYKRPASPPPAGNESRTVRRRFS